MRNICELKPVAFEDATLLTVITFRLKKSEPIKHVFSFASFCKGLFVIQLKSKMKRFLFNSIENLYSYVFLCLSFQSAHKFWCFTDLSLVTFV